MRRAEGVAWAVGWVALNATVVRFGFDLGGAGAARARRAAPPNEALPPTSAMRHVGPNVESTKRFDDRRTSVRLPPDEIPQLAITTRKWLRRIGGGVLALEVGGQAACTYAPPEPIVRVANHVTRSGTDSVAIAVLAATQRRPTGLAAFPDGGAPRVEREQGIFYLCVLGGAAVATTPPLLRRVAVVPRPDSLRSGFTPWVTGWDGPERLVVSVRGYAATESRPEAQRTIWMGITLDGAISALSAGRAMSGPATSLPRSCEAAAIADATALLAEGATPGRRSNE